jgi:hypothetical protein
MSERPLEIGRPYLVKHTTQQLKAGVRAVRYRVNVNTLAKEQAAELRLNDIGAVLLETHRPLFFDPYRRNRATGAFILIDPLSNETVAAGMITGRDPREAPAKRALLDGLQFESMRVAAPERQSRAGHRPATVWLAGSQEVAYALERKLFDRGCQVHVLADQKDSSILPELARIANAAGLITICAVGPEDEEERARARELAGEGQFVEADAAQLPSHTAEAAEAVCRVLEQRGIIRPLAETFSEGGGI